MEIILSLSECLSSAERRYFPTIHVTPTQTPQAVGKDLLLGSYNSTDLCSYRQDEQRLVLVVAAMYQVFDQYENTVRHTDVSH